nr:cadmium resistance transporter [Promineifilum sp.]
RQAAAVAGVTLANGGDNIGVYVPLFAARPAAQTALLLATFAVLLVVWTFAGYALARRSALAGRLRQVSAAVMPWVLIGLGVTILVESRL